MSTSDTPKLTEAVYEGVSTSIIKHLYMFPEEESISPVQQYILTGDNEWR